VRKFEAEPEVAEALRVVLTAGKPSRFRVLTIACQRDHVIARVWRTSMGLVIVHETSDVKRERTTDLPGYGQVQLPPIEGPRGVRYAYLLLSGEKPEWRMQCRCTSWWPTWEIEDAIAAGKRRIVVSGS
jgi:hypothetical protein